MNTTHLEVINKTKLILESDKSWENKLTLICQDINKLKYYDWVGFYMANHEEKTLHLKAFSGEPTDHTVIPFGKGICGQVQNSNKTLNIEDVKAQDNYIACSIHVKSELVVPIFKKGVNIGQIDIDSNQKAAFSQEDEKFLEEVCDIISKYS